MEVAVATFRVTWGEIKSDTNEPIRKELLRGARLYGALVEDRVHGVDVWLVHEGAVLCVHVEKIKEAQRGSVCMVR